MRLVRRLVVAVLVLVAAVVVLPPLWFAVFGDPAAPAKMPPPGRRVELPDGLGVNVLDKGEGPPVVLVHGLPGSAYDWRNLQDELASRGRRVIAYDRVGYGHSDGRPPGATFGVDDNARDLLALLEALDLRDATVVGWSYGGSTAIAAAKRDPQRIGRLVLVGSAGPGAPDRRPPAFVRLLMSDPGLLWLRAVPPAARGLRTTITNVAFSEQPVPEWWMPVANANFAQPNTGRRTSARCAHRGHGRDRRGSRCRSSSCTATTIVWRRSRSDESSRAARRRRSSSWSRAAATCCR